jgi:hypothetical protein
MKQTRCKHPSDGLCLKQTPADGPSPRDNSVYTSTGVKRIAKVSRKLLTSSFVGNTSTGKWGTSGTAEILQHFAVSNTPRAATSVINNFGFLNNYNKQTKKQTNKQVHLPPVLPRTGLETTGISMKPSC